MLITDRLERIFGAKHVILIAGGIGITPILHTIQVIVHSDALHTPPTPTLPLLACFANDIAPELDTVRTFRSALPNPNAVRPSVIPNLLPSMGK